MKDEPVLNVFNAKDFKSAALVQLSDAAEMNLVSELNNRAVSNDYFIIDQYFLKVVCKIIGYAQKDIEYLLFKSIKRSYHSFA